MTIAILLIPAGLFLLLFAFFSFVALYHMVRFGEKNFLTFVITFLYIAVSAIILFIAWMALQTIDWSAPLFVTMPTLFPA